MTRPGRLPLPARTAARRRPSAATGAPSASPSRGRLGGTGACQRSGRLRALPPPRRPPAVPAWPRGTGAACGRRGRAAAGSSGTSGRSPGRGLWAPGSSRARVCRRSRVVMNLSPRRERGPQACPLPPPRGSTEVKLRKRTDPRRLSALFSENKQTGQVTCSLTTGSA